MTDAHSASRLVRAIPKGRDALPPDRAHDVERFALELLELCEARAAPRSLTEIDAAIRTLLASGDIVKAAAAAGFPYEPPR